MKPKNDIIVENAEEELVVLDKASGKVHQLNQSATLIWNGLSEGLEADEIAVKFTGIFEVDHDQAVSDVLGAIAQFTELGLLEDQ